jgi:hypothetical protein
MNFLPEIRYGFNDCRLLFCFPFEHGSHERHRNSEQAKHFSDNSQKGEPPKEPIDTLITKTAKRPPAKPKA